jgi:PAS domain S-box-containing protein
VERDEFGKPVKVIGAIHDVTDWKKSEHALKDSEKKYRDLIETMQEGIWQIDNDSNTTYVNQKMADILGYSVDEMMGRHLFSFMDEQGIALAKKLLEKRRSGIREQHDFEFIRKDGKRVYLLLDTTPLTDENGIYYGSLAAAMDITERKRAENALEESEARFKAIFEQSAVGLAVSDETGKLLQVNKKLCDMLNFSERELLTKSVFDVTYTEDFDKESAEVNKVLVGEQDTIIMEKRFNSKNGDIIHGFMHSNVIRDVDGKIDFVIGAVIDITELKRIEKELRHANDTKDKFFSIISHDLRGPLIGIKLLSEEFVKRYNDITISEMFDTLQAISQSSEKLFKLLENLLQWSRINQRKIEYLPMNLRLFDFADEVIDLFKDSLSNKEIKCINNISLDIYVYVDNSMTQLIFRNLLSNAIKYSNKGGEILIDSSIDSEEFVVISISDEGVGISEQKLTLLFQLDKIESSRGTEGEEGTGLGLILCNEFVEKHGGKIWCESQVGKGSTFYFTLPISHYQ